MTEILYTILELEEWNQGATCSFCNGFNRKSRPAICQIRTRSKLTNKLVDNDYACQECKEKFENDELPKCDKCGRLQTDTNIDIRSNKYVCDCVKYKEEIEREGEKELLSLPGTFAFYERQINGLREELSTAEVEIDTHLEALEVSEVWNKRQKQELLDEIKRLKERVKQLEEQNKIESYEKEISELKTQLEQLNNQQITQIEVPPKEKGIKGFFKFSLK